MNRDELVERVAEALWQAEHQRNRNGKRRTVPWSEVNDDDQDTYRFSARAALAIIEPAVREECARVALSYPNAPDAGPHEAHGRDMAAVGIAAAIRAGAKP